MKRPKGVRLTAPRCIAISDGRRCPRKAAKAAGDIFVCRQHSTMWTLLLLDDGCRPSTRRALAFARWQTYREGLGIVDRIRVRRHAEAAA